MNCVGVSTIVTEANDDHNGDVCVFRFQEKFRDNKSLKFDVYHRKIIIITFIKK